MKKSILMFGAAMLLIAGTAVFTSCNEDTKSSDKTEIKTSEVKTDKYACPMHCEGDKTYDEPGKCPKCGMDLKKVEENSTNQEHSQ